MYPPPCPPAQHGVLLFVQLVFARSASGISADVRESDRGERDEYLSPAGVCQRSLKMGLCNMTIPFCKYDVATLPTVIYYVSCRFVVLQNRKCLKTHGGVYTPFTGRIKVL